GQEAHFGEPQLLPQLERRAQMATVNRVEGAAEDADGLHYIARARVSPEAGGSPQMSAASNASSSHASPTTRPLIMRSTRAARSASAANGNRDARRSACSSAARWRCCQAGG